LKYIIKKILSGAEVRNWWCGTAIPVRGAEPGSRWCAVRFFK